MKIINLFKRRQEESEWRKDFMTTAIRAGWSFNSAEKLSKSERAGCLRDKGYSGVEAYEVFERKEI